MVCTKKNTIQNTVKILQRWYFVVKITKIDNNKQFQSPKNTLCGALILPRGGGSWLRHGTVQKITGPRDIYNNIPF